MSRKQTKKRKPRSSRKQQKLDSPPIEQGAVDCRARETATPSKSTPPPLPTISHTPPQLPESASDSISVPVLLTIDQLCHWLNLSRSTIHRLDKAGKLPGRILLGRQVRYHRPAIESYIEDQLKG